MAKEFNIRERVRKEVQDLVPYDTHPYPNVIRMDLNENPYPFPPQIMEEILTNLNGDTFTRYPDPGAVELRAALARYNGVEPDNLLVGNGSDELIQLLYLTFGGTDCKVLVPVPTFSMFKINAQITGTQVVELPLAEGFRVPIDQLLAKDREIKPGIIVLVSPNNPTGTTLPQEDIYRVLDETDALVVVDEAYFEFNRETVVTSLSRYPNLIVLRTFSKAFGLAGLRVGYLMANQPVIREFNKIKQPFNANSFSQLSARIALKYPELFAEQIDMIIGERERLLLGLQKLEGVEVFPSQSNFILFKPPIDSQVIYRELLQSGILIRDLGRATGLTNCMRVTVGKKEENRLFLEKLAEILKNALRG